MSTREEIEAEMKFFDDVEDILSKRSLEILLDIRDLLLAAEERTQRFENEVERIKREREQSLNANLS